MADEQVILGGPRGHRALAEAEPTFAPLIKRLGPPTVDGGGDPFDALVSAIANQQLSVKAGATVYGRVVELCDGRITPEAIDQASEDGLRACGFSRPKVGYVKDLARHVLDGDLHLDGLDGMAPDEVVDHLTQVKGIGPWTAHMVLIFDLHHPDILATGDLGVRDGARMVFGLDQRPSPARLTEMAEPWRPYRSVACWYLWAERDRRLTEEGRR